MKYPIWTKTVSLVVVSALCIATPAMPNQSTAHISAQLQIMLNDEACQQVINQIKKLHDALAQTLSTELINNNKLLENRLMSYVIKTCSFSEISKIRAAKQPLVKVMLALCDASSAFIEEVMGHNQAQNETLRSLKEKALSACQKIRMMISGSCPTSNCSGSAVNVASLDKCYRFIASDLNVLINLQPNVAINNVPLTLQNLDHVKQALAQHLSEKDVAALIAFFESSAYTKLKNHLPQIIQLIKQSFSPEVKTKAESLFNESWNQTRGTIINFLHKLKTSSN